MIDYAFQTYYTAILLVVDFWNKELICILQMVLGRPNFLASMVPCTSLNARCSINRPDTQFYILNYHFRAYVVGFCSDDIIDLGRV